MTTSPEERVEIFFNPDGNGPKLVENWAEVAHGLLDRQRAELAGCYNHRLEKMVSRMEELLKNVERPKLRGGETDIVLSPILIIGDRRLSTFSTFMKFSHAHEVTLSEVRVELTFPTDQKTRTFFDELAKKSSSLLIGNWVYSPSSYILGVRQGDKYENEIQYRC